MTRVFGAVALVLSFAIPAPLGAQSAGGVLVGRIAAEDGRPLGAANVALRALPDTTRVRNAVTDDAGRFRIDDVPAGRYVVQAVYIGYEPACSQAITVAAGERVDVGTLRMRPAVFVLEGISVETQRAPATFAADRTLYNTADLPAATGGGTTELLQSIPELEVDVQGTVTLDGATPQIYLNGRPVPMEGEALSVFLEQFPADRIERVEIIPNPSARFDASGAGGIVNIVLKEDVELGVAGNVFANIASRGRSGGGGRLSWQKGKWSISGGAFTRHTDDERTTYDLRQNLLAQPTTFLRQDAVTARNGLSGNVDLTLQYQASRKLRLWTEGRYFRFGNESEGLRTTTHMDADQETTLRYTRDSRSDSRRNALDLNTGFLYQFGERDHELEVEFRYEDGGSHSEQRVLTEIVEAIAGMEDDVPEAFMEDDDSEDEREMTLEIDYVRPLGKETRIEVGYRGRIDESSNTRLRRYVDAATDDERLEDRGLEHRQAFQSVYATLSRRFGPFGIQLGVRAENADTRLTLPNGDHYDKAYNTLFPSANVSWEAAEGMQVRLSYSRRVRRPSAWIMDPTDRSNDPLNRQVGNPDIDPQHTHSVRMDARWSGSLGTFRLAPFYRRTEGDWERITTVDEHGVSTTTWQNLASREEIGARITASFRPVYGISGFVSLNGQQERRDASNLSDAYSGDAFRWSIRTNLSGRITDALSAQAMVSYTPARDVAQGRIGSSTMTHIGLRQRLLDGRASLALAVVDPFDIFENSFETRDPTHVQIGSSSMSIRSARLSFSYSFGGRPKDDDRRRDEGEEHDMGGEIGGWR